MKDKPTPPEIIELDANAVEAIEQRIAARSLAEEDYRIFSAILVTYRYLTNLLTRKNISIQRLKKLVFGARTETTETVLGQAAEGVACEAGRGQASSDAPAPNAGPKRRKGHGRIGAGPLECPKARGACPRGPISPRPELSLGETRLRGLRRPVFRLRGTVRCGGSRPGA